MAIIPINFCDSHLNATENAERIEGLPTPPLMTEKGLKVIDLCDYCRDNIKYSLLLELAVFHGRDFDPDEIAEDEPTPEETEGMIGVVLDAEEDPLQCRFCERNDFTKVQGRKLHERRSHREALEALETEGTIVGDEDKPTYYCSVCEVGYEDHRGLNGHKSSNAHKEAVAELEALATV